MGCSDSKERSTINDLKIICINLIDANLALFDVIERLLLQQKKINLFLRLMSIHKRTSEYYTITTNCRNHFLRLSASKVFPNLKKACEIELVREKHQHSKCNEVLCHVLERLKPQWKLAYISINKLKVSLETQEIDELLSGFYTNYYTESKEIIKAVSLNCGGKLAGADIDIYNYIKSSTIEIYREIKERVYYSEEFSKVREHMITKKDGDARVSQLSENDIVMDLVSFEVNKLSIIEKSDESSKRFGIEISSTQEFVYSDEESSLKME